VEGVVVARVVEANVTALDFRFEQLAHDGFRLVSYGLAVNIAFIGSIFIY